jgi:predicted RNA-binding Zn ribbon-like protein
MEGRERPAGSTKSHQAGRQPGGRAPAPGALGLVQSFLNSRWDLERDHEELLSSPQRLSRWLAQHGLLEPGTRLSEADLRRALDVREGLRALLFINNGGPADHDAIERLNLALAGSSLRVKLWPAGPPVLSGRPDDLDGALASIAGVVAAAQIEGSWSRFKACRGVHCGWAFYDHSRNQSGSWCSMSVCGSRAKVREYRRRKRRGSNPAGAPEGDPCD